MIISTDTISYIITGRTFDEKVLKRIAKFHGIDFPQSLEKDFKNSLSNKHKTSKNTEKKIKEFCINLTNNNDFFYNYLESVKLNEKVDLSTPEKLLNHAKSSYLFFLSSSKLTNTFIQEELEHLFGISDAVLKLKDQNVLDKGIDTFLAKDSLTSNLNLNNDFYIDFGSLGVTHSVFSINTTLYILSCFELMLPQQVSNQQIINKILLSNEKNKIKPAFYYFIEFWKENHQLVNKSWISDEDISETLNIDPSTFSRYKNGKRKVPIKVLKTIIDKTGLIYIYIHFFTNLLVKFNDLKCLTIIKPNLINYSEYFMLAQSRLVQYQSKRQTNYQ